MTKRRKPKWPTPRPQPQSLPQNLHGVDMAAKVPADAPPPITCAEFDVSKCMDCGAGPQKHGLELAQGCHTGAGFVCVYQGGVLYFLCRVCNSFVVHVAVAPGVMTH